MESLKSLKRKSLKELEDLLDGQVPVDYPNPDYQWWQLIAQAAIEKAKFAESIQKKQEDILRVLAENEERRASK